MDRIVALGNLALLLAIGSVSSPVRAQSSPPAAQPQQPSGQYQISEAMLRSYVSDQNKELPTVIENAIRWDSIALGVGRILVYTYTFLDPDIQQLGRQETDQIKDSIVRTVCGNDQIRLLLDDAVSFNFKYRDSRGKFLTEVSVKRDDCR